jgi:heme/copper-type cytochrome/quinol oxidase subunit 2
MKLNKEDRREEIAGITTAMFLCVVIICIIVATIQVIFNIF